MRFRSPSKRSGPEIPRTIPFPRNRSAVSTAIADDRNDKRGRGRAAQQKEAAKLPAIGRIERGGNLAAADVDPAAEPDDDRQPEGVAVDQDHQSADGPHVVADGPLRRRIPCDAGLHGNEDAGDDENRGDAGSSGCALPARPRRTGPRWRAHRRNSRWRAAAPEALFPVESAATASHRWSSTSCRTQRDSDRSKSSSRASRSR